MKNLYAVLLIAFFWLKSMHSNQLPQSPEEIDDTISLWVNRTTSYEELKQQQIEKFDQYCAQNGLDSSSIPNDFKNLKGWKSQKVSTLRRLGILGTSYVELRLPQKYLRVLICTLETIQRENICGPRYFSLSKWRSNIFWVNFCCQQEILAKEKNYIIPNLWFKKFKVLLNEGNIKLPVHYEDVRSEELLYKCLEYIKQKRNNELNNTYQNLINL